MNTEQVMAVVKTILDRYDSVASGDSLGAAGHFYADGKGTLNGVTIDVETLEQLAKAVGRKVHPRTSDYRTEWRKQHSQPKQ